MRLLLIGAPGAGKGTQAEMLAEQFGIAHISSGDLLRQHVQDQTALGRTIKSYLDRGDLVPDGVVMDMLRKPVVAAVEAGGYVLDGFPRTVEQAQASFPTARSLGAEVQAAIHLDVPREELVRRLLARGRGSDDTEAVIERRLQVYLDKTVPLLEYYADREWMFAVDGTQAPGAVHEDIVAGLKRLALPGQVNPASSAGLPRGGSGRCCLRRRRRGEGKRSGPNEPGDRFGGFLQLLGGFRAALFDGLGDAVAQVVFHQAQRDGLQGPGHGGHLGEDVDAVGVGFDHALQAAHLTLDPAQPLEVSIFVLRIAAHESTVRAARRSR